MFTHWLCPPLAVSCSGGMTPCMLQAYTLLQTQQVPTSGRQPWGRHQGGKLVWLGLLGTAQCSHG